MTTSYPLSWPPGFPRTKIREKGQFRTDYDSALRNVQRALRQFMNDSGKPISNPVLSSNMDLLNSSPSDPGVAVWFTWDNIQVCIPVDRYTTPASNLQAIHHIIEARRVELRHGTLALVRATFEGFRALPAPKHWSDVLKLPRNATREDVIRAWKDRAKESHPDAGGSDSLMAEINSARDTALRELGAM